MTSFKIVPAEYSDSEILAQWLLDSKQCLTINRLLFKDWPHHKAQKTQYRNAIEGGWKDPATEYLKTVDEQGEMLGFLALAKRKAVTEEVPVTPKCEDAMNKPVFDAVIAAAQAIAQTASGVDHYDIVYIYTRPASRGQGIGGKLLQLAKEKASNDGLPLSTASEPQAHEFFLKRGFEDTTHVDIDLAQWAPKRSGFGSFRLAGIRWQA